MNKLFNNCKKYTLFKYIQNKYLPNSKIDHVAYRSFDKNIIINQLENNEFKKQSDKFNFIRHNAHATWLKNNKCVIPRVFLSEYNNVYSDSNLLNTNIDIDKIDFFIKNEKEILPYDFYLDVHSHSYKYIHIHIHIYKYI